MFQPSLRPSQRGALWNSELESIALQFIVMDSVNVLCLDMYSADATVTVWSNSDQEHENWNFPSKFENARIQSQAWA